MKAALGLVVALGIIAAIAAAVLVGGLSFQGKQVVTVAAAEQEANVLIAAKAVAPLTIVDSSALAVKKVPKSAVPKGALSEPLQAVGKVAIVPLLENQAITESSFARDGTGVYLAANLPPGKRAVSVLLNDYGGMVGLLYPGSVVDVMVSFQTQVSDTRSENVTRTLLRSIQVLAVGQDAVNIPPAGAQPDKDKTVTSPSRGDQRMVTLLVTPVQAQALQMAMQRGTISLALRNPTDKDASQTPATFIADVTGLDMLRPAQAANVGSAFRETLEAWRDNWLPFGSPASTTRPVRYSASQQAAPSEKAPTWDVWILRGQTVEVRSFPMPRKQPPVPTPPDGRNKDLEALR